MQEKTERNHRKKVCYVITKGNWGGAQKYVYNLAVNLHKESEDVFVILGEGSTLKQKLEEEKIRVFEIKTLRRNISIKDEIYNFFEIFKIIKNEKPDVLHLNSPKASGIGSLIGRILRVKNIITTVHGFTWNEDRNLIEKSLIYFFSWITILLSHKTIVIAPKERDQAINLPLVKKEKIFLIKNGVERIPFVNKEDARKKLLSDVRKKDAGNVLWLGTIAELHKNKGLEYSISSLSKVNKPFIYFIIGEGEDRERLEKIIKRSGLEDRVFMPGFIENANHYLKAFDIFILPSIKEGLPFAVLEAGEASLPVIASSVGGIPDIIENGKDGILVEKKQSGEIVKSINYLINFVDKQKSFGEKLREKIISEFSIEKMLMETKKLY